MIYYKSIGDERSQKAQESQRVDEDQEIDGDEILLLKDTVRVSREIRQVPDERYRKLQVGLRCGLIKKGYLTYHCRCPGSEMLRRHVTINAYERG